MDPLEWEAEPVVGLAVLAVPLVDGLALIVPAFPPCPLNPPWNPDVDAPRAIAGAGGVCGAVKAWGLELSCATRICDVEALGPRRAAGPPAPLEREGGADWAMGFWLPVPPARAVAWAVCFAGALRAGGVAGVACTIIPSRAKGKRFPALIEPLWPWVAKIAVDGTAAS
jgi:hypothetical protein